MGNIDAGRVRIYKIPTHKFFTKEENDKYKDKKSKKSDVEELIKKNNSIRFVSEKELTKKNVIAIFENDIIRLALKDRKESKADMQLLDEIVFVKVYHLDILQQIINNGCLINGNKYIFFTATTGQQRKQTIVLIRQDFYIKHKRNITCGLDIERINRNGGQNAGKYISYNALILSTSIPFENKIEWDRCIVVNGLETFVNELVKFLDVDTMEVAKKYDYYTDKKGNKGVKIEHTDGAGMFLPGEQPNSFQVRGRYIKGAMFPFDFRTFALEVANNTKITDYKGLVHDIIEEDIRYIFTTSQFKNCDYYDSWDEYKQICNEEEIELTVNNWATKPTQKVRWAYQFTQTLKYNADINALKDMVREYLNNCKLKLDYALELIGLKFEPEKPKPLAEAMSLYPELVYDKKIMNNIKKKVGDERKKARIGKFWVDGTYTYAMPDMYAFCEYLFMREKSPKGLIPKNQIYSKSFDDKPITNVCVLRSPHLSGYEYAKRTLIKTDECKKWFVSNDTVLSIHDLNSKILQLDVDGDEVMVCSQKEIWNLAEDKPPLFYEMAKADPIQIDNDAIFDTLKKAFENCLVGFISNGQSRLWNVDKEEDIDDDLICIETALNNYSIDYPKTGVNLELRKYPGIWEKHLQYVGDFPSGIEPIIKKPYFFIEKEGKKKSDVAECEKYYEPYNESIMNRICKEIDKGVVRDYSYSEADGEFDYRMLMNNEKDENGNMKHKVNSNARYYYNLMKELIRLKRVEKRLSQNYKSTPTNDENDKEEKSNDFSLFYYEAIKSVNSLFSVKVNDVEYYNEDLAVNTIIHILYNQDTLANYFPSILWECYGDVVVKNIARNLKSGYLPVSSKRKAYKQVQIGNEDAKKQVAELLESSQPIIITEDEFAHINDLAKNDKATTQSKILFTLLCMYKSLVANSSKKAEDIWLRIYMNKQQKKKGKKKQNENRLCHNFSEIDKLAEVSNGTSKSNITKMEDTNFCKVRHEPYKYYEFQFIPDDSMEAFKIPRYKDGLPELYDYARYKDKIVRVCVECGKKFMVDSEKDRSNTCSDICKKLRIQYQKHKSYMNNK